MAITTSGEQVDTCDVSQRLGGAGKKAALWSQAEIDPTSFVISECFNLKIATSFGVFPMGIFFFV
jgi:hypothetical protein